MENLSYREQRTIIWGITLGTLLEWYEGYLYIFWAPVFAEIFFDSNSHIAALTSVFLLFGIGFLARPLGGVIFGHLGDSIGRKRALLLSIMVTAIPTFAIGFLPTYAQVGFLAPIFLGVLRCLQSFPTGGEQPGAFCYLYESANPGNRRYLSSWGAVGNQIGLILSMVECYALETWLSHEQLIEWGWRLSFGVGGIIGLLGYYLRSKLHETPVYEKLVVTHKIVKSSIFQVCKEHKGKIGLGILFCVLDAVGFYLVSALFPTYFDEILSTEYSQNLIMTIIVITITTIPLPLFGMLGDRLNNKLMMMSCSLGILGLIYLIYLCIQLKYTIMAVILYFVILMLFTCITALIPYLLCDIFPAGVRFTCVGLSYNVVDGIIGGFTPVLALYLFSITNSAFSFLWIVGVAAVVSSISYLFINEKTSQSSS